jgi:hypothetical protein
VAFPKPQLSSTTSAPSPCLSKIVQVHGRQVINSRGNPTVEAVVTLAGGGGSLELLEGKELPSLR